jgi:hypothetical protein
VQRGWVLAGVVSSVFLRSTEAAALVHNL